MSVICYVHYINSCPSVQARRALCCEFPAFLLPVAQKQSSGFEFGLAPSFLRRDGQKAEDSLEVEPLVCRVRGMVLRPVRAYQRGA